MGWTKEQEEAINNRGVNLLVSAAAGSGKTAVLVERIIKMICEEGYQIDKILVMTFTKAAAAEMKERIGNRLLEEGMKHPDQNSITQQLAHIHQAPISTIHSFCMNLLKNHFHLLSLDPNFRIGEEGEVTLLKEEVLDELMEEWYEEKEEDFLRLVEAYSYGRDDRNICDMILRLFDFSRSHPDPKQWLTQAEESLAKKGDAPFWLENVMKYGDKILENALRLLEKIIQKIEKDPILTEKYLPVLLKDQREIHSLYQASDYEKRQELFAGFSFARMPAIRKKDGICLELMEEAKKAREEVKAMVNGLYDDCYWACLSDICQESELLRPYVHTLIGLVNHFSDRFLSKKLEKNMLEFGDLEHYALKLLVKSQKNGKVEKTPLAIELSRYYQAVFTDEYQDSNLIQEVLLQAISREEDGNRFMVGDMKQSIYKFRMARPEIFLEKYNTYGKSEKTGKVELKNNFRSRQEVLYSINYLFYQMMKPSLGDVAYGKEQALTPPEPEKKQDDPVLQELLLLNLADLQQNHRPEEETYTAIELEAKMTAGKIKELKKSRGYKDMVILLRTVEGWAQIFEDVLQMEGIPVHTETRTGYFDTFEIRVLLNLLSVVDNIYQDIPMASLLRSPIGGFTGEDLAKIRSLTQKDHREEDPLYEEMVYYLEQGKEELLKEKIRSVLELLGVLRQEKDWMSLTELIWSAMEKTGYYHLAGSMPNGQQRLANIRMFLEKAKEYEKTSFKGVFHFLQYIEQLRTYQIDYGEAGMQNEEADVVRIMSIHKSKGLEFPVVFLCGLGKQFNYMDTNRSMVLHPDYYVGLDCIDLETRTKRKSLQKKIIGKELLISMLGEELRILYVAMTRAKEKLIMTAAVDDFQSMLEKAANDPEASLSFFAMTKAKKPIQWIFPALCRHPVMDPFKMARNIESNPEDYFILEGEEPAFHVEVVNPLTLFGNEVIHQYERARQKEAFLSWVEKAGKENSLDRKQRREEIRRQLGWVYEKEKELEARSKWTVSQLKKENQEEALFSSEGEGENKQPEQIPEFLKEKEKPLTGATRGTAVHKLLEKISFSDVSKRGFLNALDVLVKEGKYPKEYVNSLPVRQIMQFYASDLGSRLLQAEKKGLLYKEAQFMMGVPMKEMEPETNSDELVLVQGVIDLYMEEEGELVLIDYKTDYVKKGQEKKLVSLYETQLQWYRKALEQMTGKKVKETYLYSFSLSKAILLPVDTGKEEMSNEK